MCVRVYNTYYVLMYKTYYVLMYVVHDVCVCVNIDYSLLESHVKPLAFLLCIRTPRILRSSDEQDFAKLVYNTENSREYHGKEIQFLNITLEVSIVCPPQCGCTYPTMTPSVWLYLSRHDPLSVTVPTPP